MRAGSEVKYAPQANVARIIPVDESRSASKADPHGQRAFFLARMSSPPRLQHQKEALPWYHDATRAPKQISIHEEVSRVRARLNSNTLFSLEPHSRRMRQWDGVTFCALIFTAIVTPVEVAFTNAGQLKTHEFPIFFVNRLVDVIFITDIILQFFVAYYDEHLGGILVKSRSLIAKRYLRGWFTIDAVSSLPFDVINLFDTGAGSLTFLKSLRLLRLLKLFRVIRASRILARWEAAAVKLRSPDHLDTLKSSCQQSHDVSLADFCILLRRDQHVQIFLQAASLCSLE